MTEPAPCPCGSGDALAACCAPLHAGSPAPTAERLMRSRFTAFALGDAAYLLRSWASATRPAELGLDAGTVWRRLQIVDAVDGGASDAEGVVEFRASYRDEEGAGLLHERSRFVREDGRWVYLDGDVR
ncbi:MAG: YchJ family protein [Microbacteriaceae bacterium]